MRASVSCLTGDPQNGLRHRIQVTDVKKEGHVRTQSLTYLVIVKARAVVRGTQHPKSACSVYFNAIKTSLFVNWPESETCNFSKVPLIIFPFARLLIMILCKPECSKLSRTYLVSLYCWLQSREVTARSDFLFPTPRPLWRCPPPLPQQPGANYQPFLWAASLAIRVPPGSSVYSVSTILTTLFPITKTKHGCCLKLWLLAFHSKDTFSFCYLTHYLGPTMYRWPHPDFVTFEHLGPSRLLQKNT